MEPYIPTVKLKSAGRLKENGANTNSRSTMKSIKRCTHNIEICKARQSFFFNIISRNINNAQMLFATVQKLTNPPSQLAPELLLFYEVQQVFFQG